MSRRIAAAHMDVVGEVNGEAFTSNPRREAARSPRSRRAGGRSRSFDDLTLEVV